MINHAFPKPRDLVEQYIDEVKRGEAIIDGLGPSRIGSLERAMIDRYEHDLEFGAERGLWFDERLAARACNFFPLALKHSAGEWHKEPFILSPWQAFIVWNLWGWRWASSKYRRFRKGLIYVARKNGKTQLAAGVCDLVLLWDQPCEPDGQIYSAATKQEQAAKLWHHARKMLEASPELAATCHILGAKNKKTGGTITVERGPNIGSEFMALGQDGATQDGLSPSLVVKDELHEWRRHHRDLHEKLSTGGGARRQPLELIITTAGSNDSEILEEELEFCRKIVEGGANGKPIDDGVFAAIYRLEQGDDIFDERNWRKANPGLGLTPKLEYLRAQAAEAKLKPSSEGSFKRYNCNITTAAYSQSYPSTLWARGDQDFIELERGAMCFGGIDKSASNDWSAISLVFPHFCEVRQVWLYTIRARFWCCAGNGETDYGLEPYATWISEGRLEYQTGEILDPAPMKQAVRDAFAEWTMPEVAFDKMFCYEMAASLLNDDGIPMVDFPQTYSRYEPPIQDFETALLEGRIAHNGDDILAWNAENAEFVEDHRGRRMFQKGRKVKWKKIDGIVSTIMAFSRAIDFQKISDEGDVLIK